MSDSIIMVVDARETHKRGKMYCTRLFLLLAVWMMLLALLVEGKKNKDEDEEELSEKEEQKLEAAQLKQDQKKGGIRIGSTNMLVPDSAAELPMVVSHQEDQPLCKPDTLLDPANKMQIMEGFDAVVISNTVEKPGKMIMDRVSHILVMSGDQSIYSLRMDKCGNVDAKVVLDLAEEPLPAANDDSQPATKLGSGMALDKNFLYVATTNNVYQFPYSDGQHSPLTNGRVVLSNINPENDDVRPDVAIDPFGHAYVPRSGNFPFNAASSFTPDDESDDDDDDDQDKAMIKKFNFRAIPEQGYDYDSDGIVQAYGANTHGFLAFDTQARLWGMDQSFSIMQKADNGESVNAADELNVYDTPLARYGFPNCYTGMDVAKARAKSGMTKMSHPKFKVKAEEGNAEEYCQKAENNQEPAILLPSDHETTGLTFYMGLGCSMGTERTMGTSVGMPCNWTDTPFVAHRGATGQSVGHSVARLQFDDLGHKPRPDKKNDILLQQAVPCTGYGCFTPTGIVFDSFGRLLVASEESNEIFLVNRIFSNLAAQMLTDKYLAEKDGKIQAAGHEEEDDD
ncbi:hypothetical protein BC940DRAFT_366935 [Gongronella butleri]|nr:hypothetical protein BC940DRAFT_366935 [Gongronella butleri]